VVAVLPFDDPFQLAAPMFGLPVIRVSRAGSVARVGHDHNVVASLF